MNDVWGILTSWPFLLMGVVVFIIIAFFNGFGNWNGVGHYLWMTGRLPIRKFLKFMVAVKIPCMFLVGFALGWIPQIPRPEQLSGASQLSIALLYGIAGLFSMFIVKWFKKMAEAKGIDIGMDLDPKQQKRMRR